MVRLVENDKTKLVQHRRIVNLLRKGLRRCKDEIAARRFTDIGLDTTDGRARRIFADSIRPLVQQIAFGGDDQCLCSQLHGDPNAAHRFAATDWHTQTSATLALQMLQRKLRSRFLWRAFIFNELPSL